MLVVLNETHQVMVSLAVGQKGNVPWMADKIVEELANWVLGSATIILFSRFALLFCSLMGVTLLYSNLFLAPLLLLLGPAGAPPPPSAESSPPRRVLRPRWGRPQRALTEHDGAASPTGSVASQGSFEEAGGEAHIEMRRMA